MYIITKDIFGTWKKGKVITEQMICDKFKVGGFASGAMVEWWRFYDYIKPYKPKKK